MTFIDLEFQRASGRSDRSRLAIVSSAIRIFKADQAAAERVSFENVTQEAPSVWYKNLEELHKVVYPDWSTTLQPKSDLIVN